MTRRVAVGAAMAAFGLVLSSAVPAAAGQQPVEHYTFGGADTFVVDDCGLSLQVEAGFQGVATVRPVKGSGGEAFLAHTTFQFREKISLADEDPATTDYVTTQGNSNFLEQHATHLYGSVWEFRGVEPGSVIMRDASGKKLFHSRGMIQTTIVFDTLGDGQPGGVLLSEYDIARGPIAHDFCDHVIAELT